MINALYQTTVFWTVLIGLLAGSVFDLLMPLGVAAGVIYVIPVLLTYYTSSKKFTYFVMIMGCCLTLAS